MNMFAYAADIEVPMAVLSESCFVELEGVVL